MNTLCRKKHSKTAKILIYFSVLEVQKVEKWKMYMEIHQLLNQGFNKTQVAKKLNISRTTVYRYLNKIQNLWLSGLTQQKSGEKY